MTIKRKKNKHTLSDVRVVLGEVLSTYKLVDEADKFRIVVETIDKLYNCEAKGIRKRNEYTLKPVDEIIEILSKEE